MTRNNGAGPLSQQSNASLGPTPVAQSWRTGVAGSLLDARGLLEREARQRVFPSWTGAARVWEWLEAAIGIRIAQVLNTLQIPTARDVQELNQRVEALHSAVVALERRTAAAKPSVARTSSSSHAKKPVRRTRKSTRNNTGG